MEYAIIALILFAAAWLVVRRVLRTLLSRESGCGCGCGGSCPNAKKGAPLSTAKPSDPSLSSDLRHNGCRCGR